MSVFLFQVYFSQPLLTNRVIDYSLETVGVPMSFPRIKVLSYALFVGLVTLLFLLTTSCMPFSNYGTGEALPAAGSTHHGQAPDSVKVDTLSKPSEVPALTLDTPPSEPAPEIEAVPAAPEPTPQLEQLQSEDQIPSIGKASPSIPTPVDIKPEPSTTVTVATYVPKASKKISIPVLNYHSVTIDPGNIVVISPEKLAEQMAYLHDQGYTPLTLEAFIRLLEGDNSEHTPKKPVLLTFDDGYIDNYEQAMPILAKYGFPATLFVSPGMTEHDGYLNWEQIKKLQAAGWDIQPHGMSHPHLPKLSAEKQAYEIVEARKQIEAQLGTTADIFCYPYGEFNKTTLQLLNQHGFRYAFTIQQGMATNQQPPYQLKRIFVNGEESLKAFAAKLPKVY